MPSRPLRPPSVPAILKQLKAAGTEKKRASAIRVGIAMDKAFGVSVGDVRAIGKWLNGQHALAKPLWATGIHEARLLATIIADPERITRSDIERWLDDVVSWDLCDHLCGNLASRRADAAELIHRWIRSPKLYVKRAAFALVAELAVHGKDLDDGLFAEQKTISTSPARCRASLSGFRPACGRCRPDT
jgi:3-methyladenine DNA glycosylase AlkD